MARNSKIAITFATRLLPSPISNQRPSLSSHLTRQSEPSKRPTNSHYMTASPHSISCYKLQISPRGTFTLVGVHPKCLEKFPVMADAQNMAKFLNPLTLHLQKLDLELKCPLCLDLLKNPTLLPCNHIICKFCIPSPSGEPKSECPICKAEFSDLDLRPAPYMESLVTIYRSLHSTITSVTSRCSSSELSSPHVGLGHIDNLKEHQSACGGSSVRNNASTGGIEMREEDMHLGPEPSPVSSPSLDLSKDRTFSGSILGKCKSKRPNECLIEKASYEKDVKRQKMLDYSPPEARVTRNDLSSEKVIDSDTNPASNCKFEQHSSVAQPTPTSQRKSFCAFCHTSNSKQTAETGHMLYYSNGKLVSEITTASNVIPVHSKCIEWTPLVYFQGETIKNLESELERSAKLKCSSCGKKGAALGCFAKSCRKTYHVPCAVEIEDCRWDCEDFLMLCPVHSSVKFPKEKSKSKRSAPTPIIEIPRIIPKPEFWATEPNGPKQWVFCGSALSTEEKFVLVKFANMCGATVSKFWGSNVTHVIASTDEKGACTRTLKVLMGILHGTWILNMGWIKACKEANHPVNEEPYEISLDNHGCLNGPKTGRLRVLNNEPKLFEGVNYYFTGEFLPAYKFDLIELVRTAGGDIIESLDQVTTIGQSQDVQAASARVMVVYNADTPRGLSSNEARSVVSKRIAEAHNLVTKLNCSVIGHKMILDSIAASIF